MDWGPLAAIALGGAMLAVLAWRTHRRPKYLVTIQKVTNVNQQPETVTVQLNLPASTTPAELWEETERVAAAVTARMTTINEDILETNRKIGEEIMRKRIDRLPTIRGEIAERRRRRVSRELGVKPEEVDALLAKYSSNHLADRAAEEEAER